MSRPVIRSLAAIAAFVVPAALSAQVSPAATGVALPSAKNQVISIQPLTSMFTVYTGELERKLSASWTVGVGGTFWSKGVDAGDAGGADAKYTSGDLKLRYYPGATPFDGFSFGGQVGYTRVSGQASDGASGESAEGSTSGPSVGVALDYNWLLGASRSFYVGMGMGAKALFIDRDAVDGTTVRYPTARVSIGYAF